MIEQHTRLGKFLSLFLTTRADRVQFAMIGFTIGILLAGVGLTEALILKNGMRIPAESDYMMYMMTSLVGGSLLTVFCTIYLMTVVEEIVDRLDSLPPSTPE
ncbi:MAG: hypothetical protein Q7S48_01025 [bacterium]|nr:hypothetical protein [bacterium]